MSLLTIAQGVATRVGLPSPASVIGNTEGNIVRLLALLNEEGQELLERHRWQAASKETTFTTVGTSLQGTLAALTGVSDIKWIKNDSIWNRNSNNPVIPVDDVRWQQLQALGATGPYPSWRYYGNKVYLYPIPTAGETIAFEYVSKNWCETSGGDGQTAWAADTDVGVLDEQLMTSGGVWRWKKSMGFEYAEDFRQYEQRVQNAIARDMPKKHIVMGGKRKPNFLGSHSVADGSWTIT